MRFLLLASFPESVLSFRGALLSELVERGEEVHVAVPGVPRGSLMRSKMEQRNLIIHEVPLRRTGKNPFADLIYFTNLVQLLLQIKPDRIFCYTVKPVIYGLTAAYIARVPRRYALITGLGYAFQGGDTRRLVKKLVQSMYKFALKRAEKVFFQNTDDELLFREMGLIGPTTETCKVNGSGVDLKKYQSCALPSDLSFLFIGRLLGDKGVREYVEAARQVRTNHPDIEFGLVGWIDDNPDAIQKHELDQWIGNSSITYYGKLEDVRPVIKSCSVYVLPSYREGTPRTVLEAMAMGRPVITTDTAGCRETVDDGRNGFLVAVQSVDDLVAAITRFVDNPSLVNRMGRISRELAEEKYDVHKVNKVMLGEMGYSC